MGVTKNLSRIVASLGVGVGLPEKRETLAIALGWIGIGLVAAAFVPLAFFVDDFWSAMVIVLGLVIFVVAQVLDAKRSASQEQSPTD